MPSGTWSRKGPVVHDLAWMHTRIAPQPNGCWLWTGGKLKSGYGIIAMKHHGPYVQAHRLMYTLTKGPIGEGKCIMHSCNTPSCVNPDHLSEGTWKINIHDSIAQGRHHELGKGEAHPRHKLTQAQVDWLRSLPQETRPSNSALAKQLGVSYWTVYEILKGQSWQHSLPTSHVLARP
jgi:hypothetical protein